MQMKNIYLAKAIQFFSVRIFANLALETQMVLFARHQVVLGNAYSKNSYFRKLQRKIFKISPLSEILNKNKKSGNFQEIFFFQDSNKHPVEANRFCDPIFASSPIAFISNGLNGFLVL